MIVSSENMPDNVSGAASDPAMPDPAMPDPAMPDPAMLDPAMSDGSAKADSDADNTVTLDSLQVGAAATVVGIHGSDASIRLMEMGLVPGARINVVRRAPLGDPMDVFIQGYHLSLRAAEAHLVYVQLTPPGASA